jgi:hypothetical protein
MMFLIRPSIEEEEGAHDENHGELIKQTEPEWFGNHVLSVLLVDHDEPATYTEAMEGPRVREMARSHEIRNKVYV